MLINVMLIKKYNDKKVSSLACAIIPCTEAAEIKLTLMAGS